MEFIDRLPTAAQNVIEDYVKFPIGKVAVPYYNNRRSGVRAGFRAAVGKGTPQEIAEEAEIMARREGVDLTKLDDIAITRFLVDHNLGIDCSGFVYHVLKPLFFRAPEHTSFLKYKGSPLRKLIAFIRPVENASVRVFADPKNSSIFSTAQVRVGDIIVRLSPKSDPKIIDHMMIVEAVERNEAALPLTIFYIHSVAWQSDGMYKHGVRRGSIRITNLHGSLIEQEWTEQGKSGDENETFVKARAAGATLHRLHSITRNK